MHSLITSQMKFNFFILFCRELTIRKTYKDYYVLYFHKSVIIKNNNILLPPLLPFSLSLSLSLSHIATEHFLELTYLFFWITF